MQKVYTLLMREKSQGTVLEQSKHMILKLRYTECAIVGLKKWTVHVMYTPA